MQLFYCDQIANNSGSLSPDESAHCIRVLRYKKGDVIHLTDGCGSLLEGIIVDDNPTQCMVEIRKTLKHDPSTPHVHIAIAPTKSTDRFEWFLEKSVEIGVHTITPLICQRSERTRIKPDRLEKRIIASMKQAIVTTKPVLKNIMEYEEFLNLTRESTSQKFIGHCLNTRRDKLHVVYEKGRDVILLIGPEGDFTPDEIGRAHEYGFFPVILSNQRLRTETAGLIACHTIHLMNDAAIRPAP